MVLKPDKHTIYYSCLCPAWWPTQIQKGCPRDAQNIQTVRESDLGWLNSRRSGESLNLVVFAVQGTFYGAGQDNQGTCSFSQNFANTNNLPWTTGAALTLALNDAQFDNSAGCGLCVMYRGTGAGLGTTPIPATWTMGFVNNRQVDSMPASHEECLQAPRSSTVMAVVSQACFSVSSLWNH